MGVRESTVLEDALVHMVFAGVISRLEMREMRVVPCFTLCLDHSEDVQNLFCLNTIHQIIVGQTGQGWSKDLSDAPTFTYADLYNYVSMKPGYDHDGLNCCHEAL